LFGSPRCGVQACFHARCPCLEQPSPKNFRLRVHPSLTLSPLQSSFAFSPARHLSVLRRYLLLGFIPHRDITGGIYYSQGFQASLRSVHRLSQPLDGLLRHPALQVCFILQPRSGLTCSGGFSPRTATLPHRKSLAPVPFSMQMLAGRNRLPHLRASTSRLYSVRSSVFCSLGLTSPQLAPLFSFCLLQALPLLAGAPAYLAQSTHDVLRPKPSLAR
jgi:hypothetical protein